MSERFWRYSALNPRLFGIDATATYPVLLFLMHMRIWTLMVSLIFIGWMWWLERLGMTPKGIFHYVRASIGQWLGGGMRAETKWFLYKRRNFR